MFSNEDTSGYLKIGVSSPKTKQIVGITHVYNSSNAIKISFYLDLDSFVLKCRTSENQYSEVFSVNDTPQIPSIHYRPSKNSRNNVKIMAKFDQNLKTNK